MVLSRKPSAIKCHAIKCQMWGVVQMYTDIRKELAEGGRAYFVYPLVEESTSEIMASVKVTQPSQYSGSRACNQAKHCKVYRMPLAHALTVQSPVLICLQCCCMHRDSIPVSSAGPAQASGCVQAGSIMPCTMHHALLISSHLAASLAGT